MAQKDQFIAKLNKALEWEYAAAIQYIQHAAVITGAQYGSIAEEMVVHANEEIEHAIQVSQMIADLGGTPTIDVEKRMISPDAVTMLEQDLEGEYIAIRDYKELIKMAFELDEFGKRTILEKILADEEEHARDLLGALGK